MRTRFLAIFSTSFFGPEPPLFNSLDPLGPRKHEISPTIALIFLKSGLKVSLYLLGKGANIPFSACYKCHKTLFYVKHNV